MLIININTAERTDKTTNMFFVEPETLRKYKLYANNTSLFPAFYDINASANDLNHDLVKIYEWAFQWKKKFNPDLTKQAQEIIFSGEKSFLSTHLSILMTHL